MNNNGNITKKHKVSKLVIMCIILTLLSYVFLNYINVNTVYAAQTREAYSNKINNYKGYKELIDKLKKDHPNWNFTMFYTGLDWYQVIKNETSAYHGRNVVPSTKSSAWRCSVCGDIPHGGNSWRCASEATVSYYMDPRNWLTEESIFQFENLAYNGEIQTVEGVKKIISGIKYMQGEKVSYTKTDGTKATLEKSYAQIIMDAAKEAGISPYHLASRIRQEQGAGETPGSTATGTYKGYNGYYNFLNIKASGATDAEVIKNGLEHAKTNKWTDPQISIKEGAKVLAKNYINDGQDTLYLQKFDVDNSDGTLYYFQYMQNVSAALTEGQSVKNAYKDLKLLDSPIEFVIPVYENMPETICEEPIDGEIITQNIKVKGSDVAIRSGASVTATKIATVNAGDVLLRIEKAAMKNGEYYWDKVVLSDGKKGYMARNYIVEITDITNCNDTVVVNTSVNLRNGPGTTNTSIITMLIKGQALTRIEKGKYNIDGHIWDRVKLSDGRQGYIAQDYIGKAGDGSTNTAKTELIKVICSSGLKVREQPGTGQKVLTYLDKGNVLTRTKEGASTVDGYTWDKVVTADGIEGYIARGDSKEQYVEVVTSTSGSTQTGTSNKNDNFKLDDSNLICEPKATVEAIKEKYTNTTITVKKADGTVVKTGDVGTGYTITIGDNKYTTVKKGDTNGDGKINSNDALDVLKQSVSIITKKGCYLEAMDVNKDGKVNSEDALLILKNSVGTENISM